MLEDIGLHKDVIVGLDNEFKHAGLLLDEGALILELIFNFVEEHMRSHSFLLF